MTPIPELDRAFFSILHRGHGRQAVAEEKRFAALPAEEAEALLAETLQALGGVKSVPIGTVESGAEIRVDSSILAASALVIGATGAGKTHFLVGLLLRLLESLWNLSDPNGCGIELELVDPKFETFDLLRQALAALWLRTPEIERDELVSRVRVIDWASDCVTPSAPFTPIPGVSDAFLARLRADVVAQASPRDYTDAMRHGYFMLARLLIEKQFPLNYRFAVKLFRDESFRKRIASGLADPDLRAYFLDLDRNLPKQTSEGLLRRIQEDLSFPEIRYSEGLPPVVVAKLLPTREPSLVLGNYSSRMSLPPSKAIERANHRIVDVLLRAPRRNTKRPGLLILEEAPLLLSRSSELVEPITAATRTLRSVGMGIIHVAQDFSNALPAELVRALALNVRWTAMFRTREDAELIYPHVLFLDEKMRSLQEAARRKEFFRSMEGLPTRSFYFHAKGFPAIPASSIATPDFTRSAGVSSEDELRTIFNREFASRWTVPSALAARLIAEWEAEVVDRSTVPPSNPPKGSKTRPVSSFADFLRDLGGQGEGP